MVKDPVCGMMVNSKKPPATAVHRNQKYYFCSPGCMKEFEDDPARFVDQTESGSSPSSDDITEPKKEF